MWEKIGIKFSPISSSSSVSLLTSFVNSNSALPHLFVLSAILSVEVVYQSPRIYHSPTYNNVLIDSKNYEFPVKSVHKHQNIQRYRTLSKSIWTSTFVPPFLHNPFYGIKYPRRWQKMTWGRRPWTVMKRRIGLKKDDFVLFYH